MLVRPEDEPGLSSGHFLPFRKGSKNMRKFYEFLYQAEMLVAKYTLFALSSLVFAAAVARTIRYPISWAMDMATFLFAWCVFLGGDIAIRKNRLFCIVILTSKLPQKVQLILQVANYAIISAFLVGMIGYGSYLSYTTRLRAFQGMPAVSYTWVTISVPIGCALMLTSAIRKIREALRAIRTGEPIRKEEGITEVI
jgi:TRAP-type C4-dicarboxylate transport system permease small subunit